MVDINIPGTSYQVRNDGGSSVFLDKDGNTLTNQQFLDKVAKKEISLTENSLQILEPHIGRDTMESLRGTTGYSTPPGQISNKLDQTTQVVGDLYSLMELMARMTQEQRKGMQEVKHSEFETQMTNLEQAAEKQLEAGLMKAGLEVFSGICSIAGAFMGPTEGMSKGEKLVAKQNMQVMEGFTGIIKGIVGGEISEIEKQGKDKELMAKRFEQMTSESKDLIDNLRQTEQKVMETLQSIQQAEIQRSSF